MRDARDPSKVKYTRYWITPKEQGFDIFQTSVQRYDFSINIARKSVFVL